MQRARNNQIDSQAAGAIANVAGGILEKANPFSLFSQVGGEVPDEDEMYMMYGGKVKYQQGGPADFKPHMMYKGSKEEMANTFADHLRLKKAGYAHKKEMAEGGFLSRILGSKEKMPSQEELDAMKPYTEMDDYHYRDERGDAMDEEFREPPMAQPDAEGEGMSQFDEHDAIFRRMRKASPMMTPPLPPGYKHGGMVSQVMGPKGPMKIPTRMGGQKIGG